MEYTDTKGSNDISDEDTLDLQAVVKSEMESAQDFIEQIGQERDEATRYYLGKEPGATSELQSEYISTDVRDSVLFMLPSIMRTSSAQRKWSSLYRTLPRTYLLPNSKRRISITSYKRRIQALMSCTTPLRMH